VSNIRSLEAARAKRDTLKPSVCSLTLPVNKTVMGDVIASAAVPDTSGMDAPAIRAAFAQRLSEVFEEYHRRTCAVCRALGAFNTEPTR
jgi:hypothetical protein